nr:FAD-dependent oxidoreductase [Palleronia pontilimi]
MRTLRWAEAMSKTRTPPKTDVAIVGGGLSGLALAEMLHRHGVDVQLFEARTRLGGRIDSLRAPDGAVDLGPSWFWPGQHRIAELTAALGLRAFPQFALGDVCVEDELGRVQRGRGFASMEGAFRLAGGLTGLIEGLAVRLPQDRLHLGCPVVGLGRDGTVNLANGDICRARQMVVTAPPRVAANLGFDPALAPETMRALSAIPTWMAGHAKFVAVYDRPFWRDAGLSGDASSRRGPLMEMHDASGPEGTPAALFGFLGIPAAQRAGRADDITAEALRQLGRIFGPEALHPGTCSLKDWSRDPETATDLDQLPTAGHPAYHLPTALTGLWDGRLHFAQTETARDMGGLMEGALDSAERVAAQILGRPAEPLGLG